MQAVTITAESVVLILIFTVLYWCVDRDKGEALGYTLLLSLVVNNTVKDLVRAPRLFGVEGIRTIRQETATGYSFPSGHTQSATSFYTALAWLSDRRVLRALAVFWSVLVGFSRLYLGVHYPRDVVAGIVLGFLCVALARLLLRRSAAKGRRGTLLLYGGTALLFAPGALLFGSHDLFVAAGCLLGFAAGLCFEAAFVHFSTDALSLRARSLRWVCGVAVLGAWMVLLKLILPEGAPLTMLRYALLVFTGTGLVPWLFTRWAAFNR